jgi:hypothetical protein
LNPFELTPSLSIVIGVFGALVVISLVVLVLRRCRRRDRRQHDKAAATPLKMDGCEADEKNPDVIDVIPQGEIIIIS